jgi:hypothetical protein
MKNKTDFKNSCRRKLKIKDLHRELGTVLKNELRDIRLHAGEEKKVRQLLPSSAIPFLP